MAHSGQCPLNYKIANIEDNTFPPVDHRAPGKDITLTSRYDYHRHTLLGSNVFALEMFKQFRPELGLYETGPMLRTSLNTENSVNTAIDLSANLIAKTKTAEVKIISVAKLNGQSHRRDWHRYRDRLVRFTRDLKVAKTPVENWVLPIATGESAIP
jgi:hypothetical protein